MLLFNLFFCAHSSRLRCPLPVSCLPGPRPGCLTLGVSPSLCIPFILLCSVTHDRTYPLRTWVVGKTNKIVQRLGQSERCPCDLLVTRLLGGEGCSQSSLFVLICEWENEPILPKHGLQGLGSQSLSCYTVTFSNWCVGLSSPPARQRDRTGFCF